MRVRLCNTPHVDNGHLACLFFLIIYVHTVTRELLLTDSSRVVESSYRCVLFLMPIPKH